MKGNKMFRKLLIVLLAIALMAPVLSGAVVKHMIVLAPGNYAGSNLDTTEALVIAGAPYVTAPAKAASFKVYAKMNSGDADVDSIAGYVQYSMDGLTWDSTGSDIDTTASSAKGRLLIHVTADSTASMMPYFRVVAKTIANTNEAYAVTFSVMIVFRDGAGNIIERKVWMQVPSKAVTI
jgi:multisubunit Na+/H+ antiporter MnhG subunit